MFSLWQTSFHLMLQCYNYTAKVNPRSLCGSNVTLFESRETLFSKPLCNIFSQIWRHLFKRFKFSGWVCFTRMDEKNIAKYMVLIKFIYRYIHVISFFFHNHCKTLLIVKASPRFDLNHFPTHVFYKLDMKIFVYLLTVMSCLCINFLHVFAFLTIISNISNFTFSLSLSIIL